MIKILLTKALRHHVVLACATALLLSVTSIAGATANAQSIIYSDTFSRITGSGDTNGDPNGAAANFSDWGSNDNGLGGTVSQSWVAGPSRGGGGRNATTDGSVGFSHGTASFFDYDASAVAPLGFVIALDFARFATPPAPGPGGGGFISFGLGVDAGTAIASDFAALNLSDWAILFQQAANGNTGNANVRNDGTVVAGSDFDYGNPDIEHSLSLTVTPAVAGAYGASDVINVGVVVDGTISQNFTTTGGANFGSFAVGANNFDGRYIDNLVVTAVVPEPSSLLFMASIGMFGTLRRRRS